jgi:LDH2 family malate/lactate/ureidoglycolate dehydrogenase
MIAYPAGPDDRRVDSLALHALVAAIFVRAGMDERDASDVAGSLVTSDLRGVHSHGTMRVPEYVDKLVAGGVNARGRPHVVRDEGACLVVDADNAMGHLAMRFAMDQAAVRAGVIGIAACAVRGSNHAGAMASYAMQALPHDMIGLATTNALPTMPPHGGASRLLGINPLAVAIPAGRARPVVHDASFSHVAHGKVRVYAQRGARLPAGWATDRNGVPTTDATAALEGLLLPIGGYKGVALAMVMGVLSSLLSGAAYGTELGSLAAGPQAGRDGHFVMAIRVQAFEDVSRFKNRVDALVDEMHRAPRAPGVERIYAPGELEFETEEASRALGALPDRDTRTDLAGVASMLGVAFDPRLLA